ncbi:methyltransferase domain-containing protein [Pseudoduganella chitinolytica]|uniref:Methyltransferase domain-containing protein n=1 Tax=Pseudoduganella chitinolytica TaxID=34070 RepID=A0ABY8BBW5_9BURK|nr:methyltransferase domain-containing protein [Pseudoduganella chitinolytica]WEF32257.1 methyltransferase domain-containing protein [Pseudoduganella chitinolytica]
MQTPENIPIVAVSYMSPDLIDTLIGSLRRYYRNPVYIIDGSTPQIAAEIGAIVAKYENARFIPFGYNIHHGPGLTWAMRNLPLSGPVMFLDSDVEIIAPGFLESLLQHLEPGMYGVGDITYPILGDVPEAYRGMPYLSPACMLCNIEVMRQYPPPIKHGAPMVSPMLALAKAGKTDLVRQVDWVKNDFSENPQRVFIRHEWQGTVMRTKGYHYDTAMQGQQYNEVLLSQVPPEAEQVIEVGCGSGALTRAYKSINPSCSYTGVETDPAAVALARTPCDFVYQLDIDHADDAFFAANAHNDCWILDQVLARVTDPARLLRRIRAVLPPQGSVVLAIPNQQHWRRQGALARGEWALAEGQRQVFTRQSAFALLQAGGFQLAAGVARMDPEPGDAYFPGLRRLAQAAGGDPELAVQDALPLEYVLRAVPA